jgi:membrane fusion protein, multidrug efflux system
LKTLGKLLVFLVVLAGVVGAVMHFAPNLRLNLPVFGGASPSATATTAANAQRDAPVPVSVAAAQTADVPIYLEGVGTVKALNTVTVKPQIDGKITEITFTEGANVKKGDVLAKLDPVTVQAALDQVKAKKALDDAIYANGIRDLDRDNKVGTLGVTQQAIDTQRALVAQQKAQIAADQATIDNAQAQLAYANVASPIDGVTGIRQVDVGNIVRNQTDAIVVVAQIQPISIYFTLPQQQLGDVNRGMAKGPLSADALTTDGGQVLDSGVLKVIDNQVDPTTGTIKLKADYPNANRQLWPGQFVSVRLKVDTLKGVVVAPTAAVQQGPTGSFVYLAGDDNTVSVRTVTTGQTSGDNTVITAGLKAGDKFVTNGFSRLKDGAKIIAGGGKGGGKPAAAPASGTGVSGAAAPSADNSGGSVLATPANAAETGDAGGAAVDPTKAHHHKNSGTGADPAATPPGAVGAKTVAPSQ